VTHDPPADGTIINGVSGTVAGNGSVPVAIAGSGLGCLSAGATLGNSCVLQPFGSGYNNYAPTGTVTGSDGTSWYAFSVQAVATSKCSSGIACKLR
jgi:hypothetical protein